MNKLEDWKNRLKDRHMLSVVVVLVAIIAILGLYIYKRQNDYRQASDNSYNLAFFEVVDYVQNVETYLAKSLISTTPSHGAKTLSNVWKEANLAGSYLSQLPIGVEEISNTQKFLNQVSDYSYSLSQKNMNNVELTQEELDNLEQLHTYSVELSNTLIQLSNDINDGKISFSELEKKGNNMFAQQVSNITQDSFSNIEETFHEYAGLIYDGAFSEHLTNPERKGLTGEDISEEDATKIAKDFIGEDKIEELSLNGISENGNIPSYDYTIKVKNAEKNNTASISISRKGGHLVYANYNRIVEAQTISAEDAVRIGKEFLQQKGYNNMQETYYMNQDGVLTINYAYMQNEVVMYSDLIKVKIALDNGEILGIETTGYLNSHFEREIPTPSITKEQAKQTLNKKLDIQSEKLAMIPTEYQTEVFCWEFKGKVKDNEFLVYINAETGKEEDILVIINTPNGTLTM